MTGLSVSHGGCLVESQAMFGACDCYTLSRDRQILECPLRVTNGHYIGDEVGPLSAMSSRSNRELDHQGISRPCPASLGCMVLSSGRQARIGALSPLALRCAWPPP
jgi:hypothetical protein